MTNHPPANHEQAAKAGMTDLEQVMLSAVAGAFTGFLIWLYYIVFRFASYLVH